MFRFFTVVPGNVCSLRGICLRIVDWDGLSVTSNLCKVSVVYFPFVFSWGRLVRDRRWSSFSILHVLHFAGQLIFLQILNTWYTTVDYFSSFLYERTHHVASDAHVKYSRACIMLFLLLLPQTTHTFTCARRAPVTHAPTPRTRVANQTGWWCEWTLSLIHIWRCRRRG